MYVYTFIVTGWYFEDRQRREQGELSFFFPFSSFTVISPTSRRLNRKLPVANKVFTSKNARNLNINIPFVWLTIIHNDNVRSILDISRLCCGEIGLTRDFDYNWIQSTHSKADTVGTKATVRFREVSALERVPLQRYKCNSARSGPNLLSGLERCPV